MIRVMSDPTRAWLGTVCLIAVAAAAGCSSKPEPVALVEHGKVCGMASPGLVAETAGTSRYRLGRAYPTESTGLTSTKKRDDRADTCFLLPARGSARTLVSIAVSHHRSGPQALALADATHQQAKKAPPGEGCVFRQIAQLGAVSVCNGSLGVSVQSVGPTRYIHVRIPDDHRLAQSRVDQAVALAEDVDTVVGKVERE